MEEEARAEILAIGHQLQQVMRSQIDTLKAKRDGVKQELEQLELLHRSQLDSISEKLTGVETETARLVSALEAKKQGFEEDRAGLEAEFARSKKDKEDLVAEIGSQISKIEQMMSDDDRSLNPSSSLTGIQCSVCMTHSLDKIFQCCEGHLICGTCVPKLTTPTCPVCRIDISGEKLARNRALEQALGASGTGGDQDRPNEPTDETGSTNEENDCRPIQMVAVDEQLFHAGIKCSSCTKTPIHGTRYECVVCSEHNLCKQCEANWNHSEHIMLRQNMNQDMLDDSRQTERCILIDTCHSLQATMTVSPFHVDVMCSECGGVVFGHRYKCLECPTFDLCQDCEQLQLLHQDHFMARIPFSLK